MNESTKYVIVEWPESQIVMEHERFGECFLINDESGIIMFGSCAFFVPEDICNEIFKKEESYEK